VAVSTRVGKITAGTRGSGAQKWPRWKRIGRATKAGGGLERLEDEGLKTVEEIAKFIRDDDSMFGFKVDVCLQYLPFDQAREFLKPEVTAEEWSISVHPLTEDGLKTDMLDYMDFAIGKALDHRGLSAGRSVEKMQAWLWLLGDKETWAFADEDANYKNYGAPILKYICEKYGYSLDKLDKWDRLKFDNMALGKLCQAGCEDGCAY
jgi:hypothetical protein